MKRKKLALRAVLAVTLVSAVGCSGVGEVSSSSEDEALINGQLSHFGYAPFLREVHATSGYMCSASLIGRRTGLTAAHCADDGDPVQFCISPCGSVSENDCHATCVEAVLWRDPSYDSSSFDHDVAVLNLDRDFTLFTGIVPLMIGGPVQEQEIFTMTAYGCSNLQDQSGGGHQRFGENSIDSIDDETVNYYDPSRAHGCYGDSGGVATVFNCEFGVIVGASPSHTGPTADVLTRVDTKQAWIKQKGQDSTVHTCFEPVCGDGICQYPETACGCSQDCGPCPTPFCGDHKCNGNETWNTCPADCTEGQCSGGKFDCCGDGVCRSGALCQRLGCL